MKKELRTTGFGIGIYIAPAEVQANMKKSMHTVTGEKAERSIYGAEDKREENNLPSLDVIRSSFITRLRDYVADFCVAEAELSGEPGWELILADLTDKIATMYQDDTIACVEIVEHAIAFHAQDHSQVSWALREALLRARERYPELIDPYRCVWYGEYLNNAQRHDPELTYPITEEEEDPTPDEHPDVVNIQRNPELYLDAEDFFEGFVPKCFNWKKCFDMEQGFPHCRLKAMGAGKGCPG